MNSNRTSSNSYCGLLSYWNQTKHTLEYSPMLTFPSRRNDPGSLTGSTGHTEPLPLTRQSAKHQSKNQSIQKRRQDKLLGCGMQPGLMGTVGVTLQQQRVTTPPRRRRERTASFLLGDFHTKRAYLFAWTNNRRRKRARDLTTCVIVLPSYCKRLFYFIF